MLRRNSVITKIAETIVKVKVHERMIRDDSGLRRLQAKRDEAKKAADNLVKAIEQGIVTDFTKDRLAALQEEVNRCEIEINKAMQKTYAHLTAEDVEKYLLSKVFEDPDDIKVRKLLVNTFIREIIWYGDHMVITYNFQEDVVPEKLTKSHVEQVEKEIEEAESASSSFPVSSYICGCSSPNWNYPNTTITQQWVRIFFYCRQGEIRYQRSRAPELPGFFDMSIFLHQLSANPFRHICRNCIACRCYFRFRRKKSAILSNGITERSSYRSVCTAPGISISSLLSLQGFPSIMLA